ncbi:di-heme oxidoredictase family protein [Candidatus Korobacter versatilis]|uniref:di-heme oxidoredictase family protein n=1 Tax=Candidatus Korobacter versatilis TaxID=658062 RepID=UPI00165020A5|nr:di-heme oxidoredictase family protein [Candidatus Koribacter versatilis]
MGLGLALPSGLAWAQLVDNTQATSTAKAGINKSLSLEVGAGRGDWNTPDSSVFIINRDPFRSVRRGRQLFQRKFTRLEGTGPNDSDGVGDIGLNNAIGAGLSDSCALCHGRPRGSAGVGGNVNTRPDSRDAPHLFGLGLREMLGDEITGDLRMIRTVAQLQAETYHRPITKALVSKGISFGSITANPNGSFDTSKVSGVDPDLRVKPFSAEGSDFSMRAFIVGAFRKEMGMLDAYDPDVAAASAGARVVTPSGMVLDGMKDTITPPPSPDAAHGNVDPALVDHLEFYLLNYFKPGHGEQTSQVREGRRIFNDIGCAQCHVANLTINHDRRVADLETVYDPTRGNFNSLFATATPLIKVTDDGSGQPTLKQPAGGSFVVKDLFTDFKRHDLGPMFYERNWDGTMQKTFMTRPLWGVGSTAPYGHDGRSITLDDVILRHGGESQHSRNAYARLRREDSQAIQAFLNSLVLFPPDDTASTLDPGDRTNPNFPQVGHGSIKLTVLFNDPGDPE